MKKLANSYPAYTGSEPYIFLCFADSDAERIEPALKRLYERGCRLWYYTGKAKNKNEYDDYSRRIAGAGLAVLYLSDRARSDTSVKNDIKHFMEKNGNIIVIEADPGDSNLNMALPEDLRVIRDDEELLRTEGFHAGFIGEIPRKKNKFVKAAVAVLLAGALAIGINTGIRLRKGEDVFVSPEERISIVLTKIPEDLSELEKYPKLEKIIVPQSLAEEAWAKLSGYTIVITEG